MTLANPSATVLPAPRQAPRRRGMSLLEAFRVALQGLVANKLRSFLTMLGIIIGVSSVIIMIALGQGVAQASQAAIQRLGTNVLSVWPTSQQSGGRHPAKAGGTRIAGRSRSDPPAVRDPTCSRWRR